MQHVQQQQQRLRIVAILWRLFLVDPTAERMRRSGDRSKPMLAGHIDDAPAQLADQLSSQPQWVGEGETPDPLKPPETTPLNWGVSRREG